MAPAQASTSPSPRLVRIPSYFLSPITTRARHGAAPSCARTRIMAQLHAPISDKMARAWPGLLDFPIPGHDKLFAQSIQGCEARGQGAKISLPTHSINHPDTAETSTAEVIAGSQQGPCQVP